MFSKQCSVERVCSCLLPAVPRLCGFGSVRVSMHRRRCALSALITARRDVDSGLSFVSVATLEDVAGDTSSTFLQKDSPEVEISLLTLVS